MIIKSFNLGKKFSKYLKYYEISNELFNLKKLNKIQLIIKNKFMKNSVLIFICSLTIQYCYSQNYFVTDIEGRDQVLAISTGSAFGRIKAADNYNLLATLLGDNPTTHLAPGQSLIDPVNLTMGGVNFNLQPFVYRESGNSRMKNLPIGSKLSQFLSDPLQGEKFDLTLPFTDKRVALSDRSAFIRLGNDGPGSDYHTAIDFDRTDDLSKGFDIIAAADGIVLSNPSDGQPIVLLHTTPKGKVFITIYQHLNPSSKSHLNDGDTIKRGDKLGFLQEGGYTHLHFAVAVRVDGGFVGKVMVPERYYLIDPFGVYDYRKNYQSSTTYNYLPNNDLTNIVAGIKGVNVFMTNPINGSFFYKDEDCLSFDPNKLVIKKLSSNQFRIESGNHLMKMFSTMEEAGNALQIIKRNGYTKSCFIGRPNPSFEYYK